MFPYLSKAMFISKERRNVPPRQNTEQQVDKTQPQARIHSERQMEYRR